MMTSTYTPNLYIEKSEFKRMHRLLNIKSHLIEEKVNLMPHTLENIIKMMPLSTRSKVELDISEIVRLPWRFGSQRPYPLSRCLFMMLRYEIGSLLNFIYCMKVFHKIGFHKLIKIFRKRLN